MEEARSLFVAGSAAVEAGRWSDAVNSFRRAYALSCAPSALYNLALALRALGHHREARDAFARLLRDHPDLGQDMREEAETYRREEAQRVAVLEILGIDAHTRSELTFDGRHVEDDGDRPVLIETNAGAHSLVARIPEHQPFLWDGQLEDGQHERVRARFLPLSASGGSIDVWPIILGVAAAVLVGVGIGVGVYLQDQAQLKPLSDHTFHVMP